MARDIGGSLLKDELVRHIMAFGHNQGTRGSFKSDDQIVS